MLCAGLWLFTGASICLSARVAGEKGVTTVTKDAGQEKTRLQVKSPKIVPDLTTPVSVKEKNRQLRPSAAQKRSSGGLRPEDQSVAIDFDNVDISVFIKFISELTGKNFIIDKAVRGKVTIISPTRISQEEAYKVFESVLEVHGYTTVPAGKIIKIVSAVQARSKDIETRLREEAVTPEDRMVTQVIPLKYANPNELKKLFTPLISKSSVIVSYPPTGMLIITDVLSNIKRLFHILKVIDVEGIGEEISIIPVEYATASDMAKLLDSLFQKKASRIKKVQTRAPSIKIIPDERTNVLIILASEHDTDRVRRLIKLLDKETPTGEGSIQVYYLENANAEDLANVLMSIPSKQAAEPRKGKSPVISKEVQIIADKATNSLVITADRDDYLVLEGVIKKLDIVRRMVYIEALIMEVNMKKDFDLGVQWMAGEEDIGSHDGKTIGAFGASNVGDNIYPSIDMESATISLAKGLTLGVLGEDITIGGVSFPNLGAVIRAYRTDTDIHILSTPQIMTLDNEEAEIQVAKNIPFLTRQDTSEAGFDYSNYEFKDVGVTLNIIPQISKERFVRLKITQETSQVVEEESTVGLPTTLKRVAKTTVSVKDKHTVVIGGLIDEAMTKGISSVPCLGSIPLLGYLFKSTSRNKDKTNLFIFLTPHIIESPAEAEEMYKEKKEQIDTIKEGVIKMYGGMEDTPAEQKGE